METENPNLTIEELADVVTEMSGDSEVILDIPVLADKYGLKEIVVERRAHKRDKLVLVGSD